mmetsp:Transcript_12337/g.18089  ORF Transcript_12337/g.18089 Transcript_12337/m.18089 type:complete len:305 (+) Transcript_12337:141-1055(+)
MDALTSTDPLALGGAALLLGLIIGIIFALSKDKHPVALTQDFQPYPLVDKKVLSHDTRRFTFALPSPNHKLGLPIGQHMTLYFKNAEGKGVQRSYTPVTGDETLGTVSFVIKVYKAGVHPKFPNGGQLSQHLDSLKIGDTMQMKGPKGHLTWLCQNGKFTIQALRKPLASRQATHIGMIAGGTGITPMLQVMDAIFRNPADKTCIKMIYANQTEDDILVRQELEAYAEQYPDRFSLHYTVDKAPAGWKHSVGFISKEMIEQHLFTPTPGKKIQTFMCGPPPMIKFACLPNLEAIGFTEEDWFVF